MVLLSTAPRVLAIGAHPDDIEIGAGGFLHRLLQSCHATAHFLVLTEGLRGLVATSEPSQRRAEAVAAASALQVAAEDVEVLNYPDCRLHEHGHDLIGEIERRLYDDARAPRYDLVLTHAGEDTHADHRAAHESTLSATRDFHGTVLLYQSPSTKPNGFRPTFFVDLAETDVNQKCAAILSHISQRQRTYTTAMRTIGMTTTWSLFLRQPSGSYMEAFEVYKAFW